LRIQLTHSVKPFYLSSETVLPIKPFYLSNATCAATPWRRRERGGGRRGERNASGGRRGGECDGTAVRAGGAHARAAQAEADGGAVQAEPS
jgi:hypothetical protein